MKIKYLLSGRLFSDIKHFRKLIDSWPDNIKFPEIVEDIKNINIDDTVLTVGYLGQSAELIKDHNPNKVFIVDNAIFPLKGITNFRLLNGNLQSVFKNNTIDQQLNNGYYKKKLLDKLSEFNKNKINHFQEKDNSHRKNIIEFPWSIPLKKIIQLKDKETINVYNEEISSLKKKYTFKRFYKNGAIEQMTKKNLPIIRIRNKKRIELKNILECDYICCPTSTMSLNALIVKKKVIMSKYNPFFNYLKINDLYEKYEDHEKIETLINYIGNLNFSISELFDFINS